jgi:glycosyltransferase involved in cell wall biosynthesis
MKILVYALHYTKIRHDKGYIGGVWIRLLEILRRANRFNLEYVLVEPFPKLGYTYESIEATDIHNYENIGDVALMIIYATIKGIRRALKGDVNLILSPIGTPYGVIPAFITSLLTGIPFTIIEHNVLVFQNLLEKNPEKKFYPSLGGFYRAIRYFKHKGKPLYYTILSTLFNYFTFKIKKITTILAIGTGVKYLHSLDSTLTVKELFPANSIPSSVLAFKQSEVKSYDAIYLGSLTEEKGIIDAILAWKGVVDWNSSLNLAVIGSVKGSKIMLEKIKSLLKLYGLEDNVHLLFDPMIGAPTEYVLDVMAKSRIMLFPSTMDTWSFTVGEALSLGLPVVAYDIQAFKKSYPDCKALICVPIGDIKQLSYEVQQLLETPSKLKSLSEDALRYMEKYYTWDQVIAAEKKLYKSICFCS